MRDPGQSKLVCRRWPGRGSRGADRATQDPPCPPCAVRIVCGTGGGGRSHDVSASHFADLVAHGVCKCPVCERTSDVT